MRLRKLFIIIPCIGLIALTLLGYQSEAPEHHFDERVKIALRDAGNQLLLVNQDSTSLVKPILSLGGYRYELSFGTDLYVEPNELVQFINTIMATANLPSDYITEVRECATREVAYSFQNSQNAIDTIVPCSGRDLPLSCYTIQVIFTKPQDEVIAYNHYPIYSLLLVGVIGMGFVFQFKAKGANSTSEEAIYIPLGTFKFYIEQQQLMHDDSVIPLTQKECELLQIFSAQPNTIVKREFLIKTVWEDQGVFVGRSLDTYISKLRKKLARDPQIMLVNVHGVGYKLEVTLV